eukprot:6468289-Amphidinium_carterae.4
MVSHEERKVNVERGCEDFYWHENSPLYPPQLQRDALRESHEVISVVVSGVDLGLPYARKRRYSFGYCKKRWQWKGADDIQAEFLAIFGKAAIANGDSYLIATESAVAQEYKELAEKRANYLRQDTTVERDRAERESTETRDSRASQNMSSMKYVQNDVKYSSAIQ